MQISIVALPRTLNTVTMTTGDNILLARHGVDILQVFKVTVKDQNWF